MIVDIVSAIFLIMLCKVTNKWDEELEIKKLIKEGKEMEKEIIIDVKYKIITGQQLFV